MVSTIVGILMIAVLGGWHLRTRRHPRWRADRDARFYITTGYPLVAVAVFLLVHAPTGTDLDWVFAHLWALAAVILFAVGFQTLNAPVVAESKQDARCTAHPRTRARQGARGLIGR